MSLQRGLPCAGPTWWMKSQYREEVSLLWVQGTTRHLEVGLDWATSHNYCWIVSRSRFYTIYKFSTVNSSRAVVIDTYHFLHQRDGTHLSIHVHQCIVCSWWMLILVVWDQYRVLQSSTEFSHPRWQVHSKTFNRLITSGFNFGPLESVQIKLVHVIDVIMPMTTKCVEATTYTNRATTPLSRGWRSSGGQEAPLLSSWVIHSNDVRSQSMTKPPPIVMASISFSGEW